MLFPGAAIFESARAAGAAVADTLPDLALTHAVIDAPLLLPKNLVCVLITSMTLSFLQGGKLKCTEILNAMKSCQTAAAPIMIVLLYVTQCPSDEM